MSSRLPSWGSGLFELSTYTASISLRRFIPAPALERPYSPADGWKSGFTLAPQMGWRFSALSYARTQIQQRLPSWLAGDSGMTPELPVTVKRASGDSVMFCEPPKPRLARLRNAAARAMQIAGMLAAFD